MSKAADKKRWAILPPPSPTSSAISGQFNALSQEPARKTPVRRAVSGRVLESDGTAAGTLPSGVQELEPSDSERVTEVPPGSHDHFLDQNLETIPAPAFADEED